MHFMHNKANIFFLGEQEFNLILWSQIMEVGGSTDSN